MLLLGPVKGLLWLSVNWSGNCILKAGGPAGCLLSVPFPAHPRAPLGHHSYQGTFQDEDNMLFVSSAWGSEGISAR